MKRISGLATKLMLMAALTIFAVQAQQPTQSKTNDEIATRDLRDKETANVGKPTAETKTHTITKPEEISDLLRPLPLPEESKLSTLNRAYIDSYLILSEDTPCSHFYGGSAAIEVLNVLTQQLKPGYFDYSIALQMRGKLSYGSNYMTGVYYRIFESAQLNKNGPFYKASISPFDTSVRRVGEFSPNTREARVTIMLHELGHMLLNSDGDPLLPNDGGDPYKSKNNTQRVIDVCRDQIVSHTRVGSDIALAQLQSLSNEQVTLSTANNQHPAPDPFR